MKNTDVPENLFGTVYEILMQNNKILTKTWACHSITLSVLNFQK